MKRFENGKQNIDEREYQIASLFGDAVTTRKIEEDAGMWGELKSAVK